MSTTRETVAISLSAESVRSIGTQTEFEEDDDIVFVPHSGRTELIITVNDSDSEDNSERITRRRRRKVLAVVHNQNDSFRPQGFLSQSSHELSAEASAETESSPTTKIEMLPRETEKPLTPSPNNEPSTSGKKFRFL